MSTLGPLPRMTEGDGVDLQFMNEIIDRLNALQESNNVQAIWEYDGSRQGSGTSPILVQGGSVMLSQTHASDPSWASKTITFPKAFETIPSVVISPNRYSYTYYTNTWSITPQSFVAVIQNRHDIWNNPIGNIRCNWVAIGVGKLT
jgi:hypothetical protein